MDTSLWSCSFSSGPLSMDDEEYSPFLSVPRHWSWYLPRISDYTTPPVTDPFTEIPQPHCNTTTLNTGALILVAHSQNMLNASEAYNFPWNWTGLCLPPTDERSEIVVEWRAPRSNFIDEFVPLISQANIERRRPSQQISQIWHPRGDIIMLADMATVLINGFLYTAAGNALLFLLVGRHDMGGLVYQLHNSQKSNTFQRNNINIPCSSQIQKQSQCTRILKTNLKTTTSG